MAEPEQKPSDSQNVILAPGLKIWTGMLAEEYLAVLKPWSRAAKVFTEMQDDAVIGALLESIKTPLLSSPFEVHPASKSDEDRRAAKFLSDNIFNIPGMEWIEHVEEMLEFLDFGWAMSEKVLEKREDGKLHLASLIPIGQETLYRWGDVDRFGDVTSFTQRDFNGIIRGPAPLEKLVHFTLRSRKRNPQGRSLLRSLYRPWYFKTSLEVLEAIGAERDVGNAPMAELGDRYYSEDDIAALKAGLEGFRVDEALYLIVPTGTKVSAYGGGNKVYDLRKIIRDWQHVIRQRFFADFLSLGSEKVGTQALAREMTTFFGLALRFVQQRMLATWNRQLVPWLFHWNRWELARLPQIAWTPPGQTNVQSLAQAYSTLISAGILVADEPVKAQIRKQLGLPPPQDEEDAGEGPDDDADDKRDKGVEDADDEEKRILSARKAETKDNASS